MAYVVFLVIYTYMVLEGIGPFPRWYELYCILFVFSLGCERFREFLNYEPHTFA
jgi:uncharacterized membrane protein YhdT